MIQRQQRDTLGLTYANNSEQKQRDSRRTSCRAIEATIQKQQRSHKQPIDKMIQDTPKAVRKQ